ncbi:MAG: hypothetical protein WBW33_35855 [Bryobacteraceae bacterium]
MTSSLLRRLFRQPEPQPEHTCVSSEKQMVMVVTALSVDHDALRALSNSEGWHVLVAPTVDAAIAMRRRKNIAVILYDHDLPGTEWQRGVAVLLKSFPEASLVLLSLVIQEELTQLSYASAKSARKTTSLMMSDSDKPRFWPRKRLHFQAQ